MGESQGTGSRGELRVSPGPQAPAPGCGSGFHIPPSLLPAADAATQSLNSDLLTDFAIWHVPLSSTPHGCSMPSTAGPQPNWSLWALLQYTGQYS